MSPLRDQDEALLFTAGALRLGIRHESAMPIHCKCRVHAAQGVPVDELGHIKTASHRCLWEHAVNEIYRLERLYESRRPSQCVERADGR
jgi:hypothetical protein